MRLYIIITNRYVSNSIQSFILLRKSFFFSLIPLHLFLDETCFYSINWMSIFAISIIRKTTYNFLCILRERHSKTERCRILMNIKWQFCKCKWFFQIISQRHWLYQPDLNRFMNPLEIAVYLHTQKNTNNVGIIYNLF